MGNILISWLSSVYNLLLENDHIKLPIRIAKNTIFGIQDDLCAMDIYLAAELEFFSHLQKFHWTRTPILRFYCINASGQERVHRSYPNSLSDEDQRIEHDFAEI